MPTLLSIDSAVNATTCTPNSQEMTRFPDHLSSSSTKTAVAMTAASQAATRCPRLPDAFGSFRQRASRKASQGTQQPCSSQAGVSGKYQDLARPDLQPKRIIAKGRGRRTSKSSHKKGRGRVAVAAISELLGNAVRTDAAHLEDLEEISSDGEREPRPYAYLPPPAGSLRRPLPVRRRVHPPPPQPMQTRRSSRRSAPALEPKEIIGMEAPTEDTAQDRGGDVSMLQWLQSEGDDAWR